MMTPQALIPALLIPLIGFRIYRRMRSNFGKQPIRPGRMSVRVAFILAVIAMFLAVAGDSTATLGAEIGGLAAGSALAILGLRLTNWHFEDGKTFYIPNSYIGIAVSLILVSRITYRLVAVSPALAQAGTSTPPDPLAAFHQSPLTLSILMLTLGYYLTYSAGLLITARKHARDRSA